MPDRGTRTVAGPVNPGVVLTKFMVALAQAYDQSPLKWLTNNMPMNTLKKLIGGLGSVPAMTRFKGTNNFQNLTEQELLIICDKFQSGIEYDQDLPNDEIWQELNQKIPQLAQRCNDHAVVLLSETLNLNPLCYDGKALFADDHPLKDGGVNDNLIAGAGISLANITADYWKVIKQFRIMKDDQNQYLHRRMAGKLVRCPPALEDPFSNLQTAILIGGGDSNIVKNRFELWVDVLMPDTNDWEMYITDEPGKVIMHGEYLKPTIKTYKKEDEDLIRVSAKRTHGMIPGDYTLGVRVTNA